MNMYKKEKGVLAVAKNELVKEKRDKIILYFLLVITIISTSFLFLILASNLVMTGYATYFEGKAGYIHEINLYRKVTTDYWAGSYGLAFRIEDFVQLLDEEYMSSNVTRMDLFFDCVESGAEGGNEVYATNTTSIDFDNLVAGDPVGVDRWTGCNTSEFVENLSSVRQDCAVNTYTQNLSFMVGTTNITNVPGSYTYQYDGNQETFDFGLLHDGTNYVYVTHIENLQSGYVDGYLVQYQLLLPTPPEQEITYYFFTDPNDECPEGGIGENVNSTMYGYVTNNASQPISGATVSVAGYSTTTDVSGWYNLSFLASTGVHNILSYVTGYDVYYDNITINFSFYNIPKNITLEYETPGLNATIFPVVSGYVRDSSGAFLDNVSVRLGDDSYTTNSSGYYIVSPSLVVGAHPIIAIKTSYENYYYILTLINSTNISHNITMFSAQQLFDYETGPYTTQKEGGVAQQIVVPSRKRGEDYWISTKALDVEVRRNTFVEEIVSIYNFKGVALNVIFDLSDNLEDFVKLESNSLVVPSQSFGEMVVTFYGTRPVGVYNGTLTLSGDIENEIPIVVRVVEKNFPVEVLLGEIDIFNYYVAPGEELRYKLNLQNLLRDQGYQLLINVKVRDFDGNIVVSDQYEAEILNSLTLLKTLKIPDDAIEGDYFLDVDIQYLNLLANLTAPFEVRRPLYLYSVFGIPLWIFFAMIAFISFIFLNMFLYKVYKERKKRYRISLDYATLPKAGDRVAKLGLVAETKRPAYYEIDRLTTHAIVSGATGMGKSISAQVLIEEALMNNVAVIVFDPTAQWSGMLRKCTDKKMMSYYPKFGLKETDSRAFKGNVKQVKDARQIIDVRKYMNPGQIMIFTLNKLQPKDIDVFVANVIRGIFKSDPKESPNLKMLLVFDEVHRLLSKFGGSGEGFLQVERACREFRKWGLGVVLISQVLADFVGEIKANINTEVQTRTIEEGDLGRIKTKYGEEYLKSLVRAEVGVSMFQNAEYNRGKPYFINFRPILHNTRRLSDEELEKYNQYNDILDDLEYQIEQLKELGVDVFDLNMELKLMKDKVMTGNFAVVEIYLEGIRPRVEKEWNKLGKKPKKLELKLVSEAEIKKSVEEAKKERAKAEAEEKKEEKEKDEEAEKKQDIKQKIVGALTFDNGIMISSLKELIDVLPSLDEEVFALHVNENKNDIEKWVSENFGKVEGDKLKSVKDKAEIVKMLENIGKVEEKDSANIKEDKTAKEQKVVKKKEQVEDKKKDTSKVKEKKVVEKK